MRLYMARAKHISRTGGTTMHSKTLWRLSLGIMLVTGAVLVGRSETDGAGALRIGDPAPDITGDRWINSEPLSLETLRGRVVVVEFWTYG